MTKAHFQGITRKYLDDLLTAERHEYQTEWTTRLATHDAQAAKLLQRLWDTELELRKHLELRMEGPNQ